MINCQQQVGISLPMQSWTAWNWSLNEQSNKLQLHILHFHNTIQYNTDWLLPFHDNWQCRAATQTNTLPIM